MRSKQRQKLLLPRFLNEGSSALLGKGLLSLIQKNDFPEQDKFFVLTTTPPQVAVISLFRSAHGIRPAGALISLEIISSSVAFSFGAMR